MKATGVVRKVDYAGRVSIPVELRRELSLLQDTPIEISVSDNCVYLNKYSPKCVFCGNISDLKHKDQNVCLLCLNELRK